MYGDLSLNQLSFELVIGSKGREAEAVQLFSRQLLYTQFNLLRKLLGRTTKRLLDLAQVERSRQLNNRHHKGIQTIAVNDIHGTLDRSADFDYDFHPLKQTDEDRWCRVASAMLQGIGLPPIEVVQVEDEYFVKDGHHRISVARALGYRYLDAVVEVWGE